MNLNQKPQKPLKFTVNSSQSAQGHCQLIKDSLCNNLPLYTHDEDRLHHQLILKLASCTHKHGFWIETKNATKFIKNLQRNYNKDKLFISK